MKIPELIIVRKEVKEDVDLAYDLFKINDIVKEVIL